MSDSGALRERAIRRRLDEGLKKWAHMDGVHTFDDLPRAARAAQEAGRKFPLSPEKGSRLDF
jgi:hypothetical protein